MIHSNNSKMVEDKRMVYCEKCKRKTLHIESGFSRYNEKLRCIVCDNEVFLWNTKLKMGIILSYYSS